MEPDRFKRLRKLILNVSDLPEEDRQTFLAEACKDDSELLREAQEMLAHDTGPGEILREAGVEHSYPEHRAVAEMISHYRIVEKAGVGGMGVVYKAEDLKLKRTVALKFMPAELAQDPVAKARFAREAQAAAALDHPAICTIHEIEDLENQSFIAMAYVDGETLTDKIKKGPLQLREAKAIAVQVADGLKAAHARGVVHRDIKPGNILLTSEGRVKITDFGLAKVAGESPITAARTRMGTGAYMSPEQARGETVDHRTDIWSLGVVLYEMLTGERPFTGKREEGILYKLLNEAPIPMRDLKSDVPLELERIVGRALAKDPDDRYQQAGDLLIDLEKAEGGLRAQQPVHSMARSSIAVLPFANMSGDPEFEYFTDGLAEELINALTHVRDLRVMARTSAFSFKGKDLDVRSIGRKLNVATILEGSVRKAEDRLRITAQLINVVDGYHLWSERYDQVVGDVFEIQDEISLAIVEKLKVQLAGDEKERMVQRHTENLEAYHLYLKGHFFRDKATPEDLKKAIDYFNQAIAADPNYALAYAGIAATYNTLGFFYCMHRDEVFPKAKVAAAKALKLAPELTEARAALGFTQVMYDWDWEGAERTIRDALKSSPNSLSALSMFGVPLLATGRTKDALEFLQRAVDLDPLSVTRIVHLGMWQLRARHVDQARHQFLKALELAPDHPVATWMLGQVHIAEGEYDKAIQMIQRAECLSNGFPPIVAALGWAYATSGRTDETREIYARLQKRAESEYIMPFLFAKLHCALGEVDIAFRWLEKSYEERDPAMVHILTDESIDALRLDPRYMEILKRMNLDQYV